MDGFRSLDAGERVRFVIRKRSGGDEATAVVSAEAGGKLKGSSIRPLGRNKSHVIRLLVYVIFANSMIRLIPSLDFI